MSRSDFIKQPSDFKAEKSIAGLYDLGEPIGEGKFSIVKEAKHVFTGERVAVKIISKDKVPDVHRETITQEARCMQLVQHPYIVRLLEVFDTPTKLYLIMECGDGGDLHEFIVKQVSQKGLPEALAKRFFGQIVQALAYCHQMHVVHRDLKPENIVVFKKTNIVKLTDFGFSRKIEPGVPVHNACGSLAFSAPEIFMKDSYDPVPVDVWSLGVILYWLVCGRSPFAGVNDSETLTRILDCKYKQPPHNVSADCRHLISQLLRKVPKDRATLKDILVHRWLKDELSVSSCESLLAKEHISPSDHALIVNIMVEGKVATKNEILAALEQRRSNHITATYFLLAGRICQKPTNSGLDAEPDLKRQTVRNKAEPTPIPSTSMTRSDSNPIPGKTVQRAFSIIREESLTSVCSLKGMSRSHSCLDLNDQSDQPHASQSLNSFSPNLRRKPSSEIKSKPSGVSRNPLLQLKEDTAENEIQSADAHKITSSEHGGDVSGAGANKTSTCIGLLSKKWAELKHSAHDDQPLIRAQVHADASEVKPNADASGVKLGADKDVGSPENHDENVGDSDTQRLQPEDGTDEQKPRPFRARIAPFFIDVVHSRGICKCCKRKPCTCCAIQ